MNTTSNRPGPNEREELARLLPGPVERDLPSGRHRRIQEFVMSQIDQDPRPAEQSEQPERSAQPARPVRRASRRRPVLLASALTALAGTAAAAVVIGGGGSGGAAGEPGNGPATAAATSLSGRQILLAAAGTAERAQQGSGTYWHVKTTSTARAGGARTTLESWTRRDGGVWWKGEKTGGKVVRLTLSTPFRLGGPEVSFAQLQKLPTEPDALKAWIAASHMRNPVKTSAGRPGADMRNQLVFDGLVSLISQLPTTPKVRAAAFRAIASYPNVTSLGTVKGGQGLSFSVGGGEKARLVVDPKTSRITDTDFFVSVDGTRVTVPGGATITAGWTNQPPK
ncbi:CU044_5270 family protein [Actinomadura viridis]|uniref:CU044_5270 family protein n=1 Tax=Actinomadura viridis TaxID=58110 RepID=UPI0036971F54